jgi:hypothetical protein
MKALSEFSRSEKITGVAGVLLLIGIFAFPWYYVGIAGVSVAGHTYGGGSYSSNVLQGPGSFFSIVALIALIALLAELAISRFTSAELPELPISWGAAELYAAVAVLALLVIKILFHIGNFGWGFYADLVLAIALVYGATGLRHGRTVRPARSTAAQHGN